MKKGIKTVLALSLGITLCLSNSVMVYATENDVPGKSVEINEEISNQDVSKSEDSVQEKSKSALDTNNVVEVPTDGMIIVGGIYYGISKDWFQTNNPNKETLNLSVSIPSNVTTIYKDGLKDSWSVDKQTYNAVTANDDLGRYVITHLDFSNATNLTTINNQAAMGCSSLTGILDLSNTGLETFGQSAFSGCTGLTGVILPSTLKNIGSTDSGSVFNGCTGLQFIRSTDGNTNAVFELPKNLQVIGRQSFKGCTGFLENTTVSIPASVTFVGSEAFYETPSITTIFVYTNDASGYDGKAFKGNDYGIGKRLTVFNNSSAKMTFKPSGNNAYSNSLTYEFTLHYDTVQSEAKLWGQAVNTCKNQDGNWYVNEEYTIPEASVNAPVGYTGVWIYNGSPFTNKTVLKPSEDELTLTVSYALQEPTIQFIVDGQMIETEDTCPKLNLSNNKEHTIGVDVSHPVETLSEADVKVKFEYKWTDVWQGGIQGPRMEEDGFGVDGLGNPLGTNTITINGAQHERTSAGNYSREDYGDGYYLLEIYGYSCPKSGGTWDLFYKSASTGIGSGPDHTTDTVYKFHVVTSTPVQIPEAVFTGNEVIYGYDSAEIVSSVSEIDGQTNIYQWYKATESQQSLNGEIMEGEISQSLKIEQGKPAGKYYYYLEVTSMKALNGDVVKTNFPVTFTVNKAESTVEIITENMDKTYDKEAVVNPEVTQTGSAKDIIFKWYKNTEGNWEELTLAPVNAGAYKVVASVAFDDNYNSATDEKEFIIKKAPSIPDEVNDLILGKGQPLGAVELPKGFTWKDETIVADELGTHPFEAIFTPEDTANYEIVTAVLNVEVVPVMTPLNHVPAITADDKTLTVGDSFDPRKDVTAMDTEDGDLTDELEIVENTVDTTKAGTYYITYKVTDKAGASSMKTINIIVAEKEASTEPVESTESTEATKPAESAESIEPAEPAEPEKPENNIPKTGDSMSLWLSLLVTSGLMLGILGLRRKKKNI